MSESIGVANINANSSEINERKRERESSSSKYTKNFTYEIETPSDEICNNYVVGINYLLSK